MAFILPGRWQDGAESLGMETTKCPCLYSLLPFNLKWWRHRTDHIHGMRGTRKTSCDDLAKSKIWDEIKSQLDYCLYSIHLYHNFQRSLKLAKLKKNQYSCREYWNFIIRTFVWFYSFGVDLENRHNYDITKAAPFDCKCCKNAERCCHFSNWDEMYLKRGNLVK